MAQSNVAATYEQFRFDVFLIKSTGDFSKNPVIANFGTQLLAFDFAEWYTKKNDVQLCIVDLKTDQIKYFGTLRQITHPAFQPREPRPVTVMTSIKTESKKKTQEPVAAPVIESHNPTSKRDVAIALLKVVRDNKPLPARKIAEKAGLGYDIVVKRTLRELGQLGKIVFDNGRWRKP